MGTLFTLCIQDVFPGIVPIVEKSLRTGNAEVKFKKKSHN